MKKRYLVLFLICILLSSMALPACDRGNSDEGGVSGLSDVTLWGMPGTEKVYQNIDRNSEY